MKRESSIFKIVWWDDITKNSSLILTLSLFLGGIFGGMCLFDTWKGLEACPIEPILIFLGIFSISLLIIIYRVLKIYLIIQGGIEVKFEFVARKKYRISGGEILTEQTHSYVDQYVYYFGGREYHKEINEEKIEAMGYPKHLFVIVDPNNPKIAFWRVGLPQAGGNHGKGEHYEGPRQR